LPKRFDRHPLRYRSWISSLSPVSEHDGHDGEEILAADEPPTPLWLPVLGATLFFLAFIWIAAG